MCNMWGWLSGYPLMIEIMKKSKNKEEKPKPIKVEALKPIYKG